MAKRGRPTPEIVLRICHCGVAVPFLRRDGTPSRAADTDRTVMGLLGQAPIRSRSPNWLCLEQGLAHSADGSLSRHPRGSRPDTESDRVSEALLFFLAGTGSGGGMVMNRLSLPDTARPGCAPG